GEYDVELAEFFHRLLDRLFGRRDVGGVGDQRQRVGPEFVRRGLQRRPVPSGYGDLGPLGHEQPGGREPDAAVAAGNERRPVRKSHRRLLSAWWLVALLNCLAI